MNPALIYLLKSGISMALFYLIYRLLLRKETFFRINRLFLLLAMPVSLLIPAIHLQSPFLSRSMDVTGYSVETVYEGTGYRTDITDYLLYVYIGGAVLLLVIFMLRLGHLAKLVKKYGITEKNGHKFVFTDNGISDFTFFNLIFLDTSKLDQNDLEQIISHEIVHIRQYHTIDILLTELYSIVQWFNPFVWPYKRAIKETHEFLADEAVIAQGCDRAGYQTLIFERFVGVRIFSLANNFHQSQIRRRIAMMQKKQSGRWSRLRVLLILPVFSILILAFARPKALIDTKAMAQTGPVLTVTDQSTAYDEDTKKKEEIKKLETMLKELKAKYKKAETEDEKAMLKKKMAEVEKKLQMLKQDEKNNMKTVTVTDSEYEKMYKKDHAALEQKYKDAETDEERDAVKKKLQLLDEKYKKWQHDSQEKEKQLKEKQEKEK